MSPSFPDTDRCPPSAKSAAAIPTYPTMRSPQSNDVMFRRVRESDYPALLELQEANLRDNLSEVERSQGFLSARFSREQFAAMDQDVAVIVATLDGVTAGYLCGSSVEF